jgi:DNA-damage-inducible protein J
MQDQISVRIDHATKIAAEGVFQALGLSATDAVRMFYKQVVLHRGLPFPAKLPNAETLEAFQELDAGGGHVSTLEDFKAELRHLQS